MPQRRHGSYGIEAFRSGVGMLPCRPQPERFPVSSPTAPSPDPGFRRLVYPLALSVGVGFGAILYGTSVLITSSAAGAQFSLSLLSLAFSGSVLTGAAAAVPVGRYADRHGIRAVVALGGLLVFMGFLGFAVSSSGWQVLAAWWLLIGPGSTMVLFEPAFIAMQQWFTREQRNRAAGTLTLITGLAGPVFIPSVSYLVEAFGWRTTAVLLGASVLVVSGLTAGWALRAAPVPQRLEEPESASLGGAEAQGVKRGLPAGFLLLSIAVALTMAVLEAFNVHRIARFEAAGFDPSVVAWWAAAVGLLSLPARFLLPVLANRLDSAKLYMGLTVLIIPAVLLAVRGTEAWEMYGHFILFGLLFGAFIPLRAVIMSDWYSGATFGTLMGIQAVGIALGRAAGPAAVGWLAETPWGYPSGMALLVLLLGLSLGLLLIAARRRTRG
ncbi:MFS transporter [Nesterenkonia salmonea]|uniref:MFS transporter n=1 Tax=Nesterenkonia salmonea TaxID=1804987 RepID=A0A5R9BAV2_9MICC|nr:MFS transporter [Nesterenkonia salmonea]